MKIWNRIKNNSLEIIVGIIILNGFLWAFLLPFINYMQDLKYGQEEFIYKSFNDSVRTVEIMRGTIFIYFYGDNNKYCFCEDDEKKRNPSLIDFIKPDMILKKKNNSLKTFIIDENGQHEYLLKETSYILKKRKKRILRKIKEKHNV